MRKSLAVLLCLSLLGGLALPSLAVAEKRIDYQQLDAQYGYAFDALDKRWQHTHTFTVKYADATIVLGLTTEGNRTDRVFAPTVLYAQFLDLDGKPLRKIEKIDVYAANKHYTFKTLIQQDNLSYCLLGTLGRQMLQSFLDAEQITLNLWYNTDHFTILDVLPEHHATSFKAFAEKTVEEDVFAAYPEDLLQRFDTDCGAYVM